MFIYILHKKVILYNNILLQEDLYYPHPMIQYLMRDSLYIFTESFLTRWPFSKFREKSSSDNYEAYTL